MGTHYEGTAAEIQALDTYIKLLRAIASTGARIEAYDTHSDLTNTQFGVLEALFHLGPLHQSDVGKKLLTSKSNVTAVLDQLENRGLVQRERSTADRRYIMVNLTAQGAALIADLLPGHVTAITTELSCLTQAEQRELARLCKKLGLGE